jgi:TonB family protein
VFVAAILIASVPCTFADDGSQYPPARLDPAFPNPQPPYPDQAQINGEQGRVTLDVQVRPSGRPAKVRVEKSSGFDDLDTAAVQGVLNWHFIPATSEGDTVTAWRTVTIDYRVATSATVAPPAQSAAPVDHDIRDGCPKPTVPPSIDGRSSTDVQVDAQRELVNAFIRESDHYQQCIRRFIGQREDLAFSVHSTVPKWFYDSAQQEIDANQKDKEAVGKAFNDAVQIWQASHPH